MIQFREKVAGCGTVQGYRSGCRCDACRVAQSEYKHEWRRRTGRIKGPRRPWLVSKMDGSDETTREQAAACRALAEWHGADEQPEPRTKPTKAERIAKDPDVRTFYAELAAFRARHPDSETEQRRTA